MKNIDNNKLVNTSAGWWKPILTGVSAAFSFAIGKDLKEVWEEGWNDPFGRN